MIPAPFEYVRPRTLEEACQALERPDNSQKQAAAEVPEAIETCQKVVK